MKITDEMLLQHAAEARNICLETLPSTEELLAVIYSKSFERKMRYNGASPTKITKITSLN